MADLSFIIWVEFIKALWILFPTYAANIFPPLAGGKTPIDLGMKLKTHRIFGEGKTIKGFLMGVAMGTFYGGVEGYLYPIFNTYSETWGVTLPTMNLFIGFMLGLGVMTGDLMGSFIKRRFGFERGYSVPILDQLNFIIGAIAFTFFLTQYTLGMILIMLIITPIIHRIANIGGYLLKIKKEPW